MILFTVPSKKAKVLNIKCLPLQKIHKARFFTTLFFILLIPVGLSSSLMTFDVMNKISSFMNKFHRPYYLISTRLSEHCPTERKSSV